LQTDETAQQESRRDQQHEGQRDFSRRNRPAQTPPRDASGAARFLPEDLLQIRPRRLQRRCDAEHQAGKQRDRERKTEDHRVHARLLQSRDVFRQDAFEDSRTPVRDRETNAAADQPNHCALSQQLPRDARARRAEDRSDANLVAPTGRACEQQVGDVRAGDEQYEGDRAEQDERGIPHLRHDAFVKAAHPRRHVAVGLRPDLLEALGDSRQIRLGLRRRDARPHPPDRAEEVRARRLQLPWREVERQPELRSSRPQRQLRRHDADDGVRLAVDRDSLPDDPRVGAEAAPPEAVTEHHHSGCAVGFVGPSESATEGWCDAQRLEVVGRDARRDDALRFAATGEVHRGACRGGELLQRLRVRAPVEIIGRGQPHVATVAVFDDGEEAFRFAVGKRPEHDRVHETEDRRGGAGPERHGQDRDGGESRILEQRAHAVAHVLPQCLQHTASPYVIRELAHPAQIAEALHRRVACIIRSHAVPDVGLDRQFDMRAHLQLDVVDDGVMPQERAQACSEDGEPRHGLTLTSTASSSRWRGRAGPSSLPRWRAASGPFS
jgi:hypothetical protein